jgi:heptosyltransferase-2
MATLDRNKVKKILIRGPNWIGDAVMCTPALAALRSSFPHAQITLLVNSTIAELLQENPHLDHIWIYDKAGRHRDLMGKLNLSQEIARESFDVAVLFQNAFEAALLARLARIPVRYGYPTDGRGFLLTVHAPLPKGSCHQVDYYLHLLKPLGINGSSKKLCLKTTPQEDETTREYLRSQGIHDAETVVGINPGATYGAAKRWSTERYARLADRMIESLNAKVLILGGPGEEKLGHAISAQMKNTALVLSGRLTVRELMAAIRQCNLLITNDSGPMHIAAAFEVPLVAIFGPTNPRITSPWSDQSSALSASGGGSGGLLLRKPVECSPCLLRECPIDHRCMTRITVEEVFEAAEKQLKAQSSSGGSIRLRRIKGEGEGGVAVFLDRDGTINEDVGYLDSPERLKLIPKAAEAIRQLNENKLKVVILTNQSGVARGYYTEETLKAIHHRLEQLLAAQSARLDGIYYCTHHPDDDCDCRKPALGMLEEARRELSLDLSHSYVIGDKITDVQLAHNAGAKAILVLTGYGKDQIAGIDHSPDFVARDLFEAVQWVIEDVKKTLTVNR